MEKLLEKYSEELKNDLQLDEINVKDKSLMTPSIKHKWVKRLIDAKIELNRQDITKSKIIDELNTKITNESNVSLSPITIRKAVENTETYRKIEESIEDQKVLVEYLEKIEKIVTSLTYDLKNVIDVIRLEST